MKHKPCRVELMNKKNPENTICETLRQAYHLIDNNEARVKLRIATTMAKRMERKLREYKRDWDKTFW